MQDIPIISLAFQGELDVMLLRPSGTGYAVDPRRAFKGLFAPKRMRVFHNGDKRGLLSQ